MNVFLTGATGYVGTSVSEQLLAAGHQVVGLARNEEGAAKLRARGITPVIGDLKQPDTLREPARQAEGIVHCGFVHDFSDYAGMIATEQKVLNVFQEVLAGSGKPFVATAATGYLQDTGTDLVDETFPIDSNSPFAARADTEAQALKLAEQEVRASVLRLPMCVYGRGGSAFVPMLLQAARANGASYWVEPGDSRQSVVHVDDLAGLYVLALQNAPAGSLYNAVLETGIVAHDLARAVAENTGQPLKPIAPEQAMPALGPILTTVLTLNNNTSGAKAERELGWRKNVSATFLEDIARGSYKA